MALRVVFADDNYLVREGMAALLAEVDEIDLVDAVADPQSLLSRSPSSGPDAVLTDIRMPPTFTAEGIDAAKRIRADHPDTGVVVLSQYVEEDYAFELLKDGVGGLGYLLKERVSEVDELVRALHEVARGGSALDPKVVEVLMAAGRGRAVAAARPHRPRARRPAEMATGRNNAAIAKTLFLSERAVEKHIGSVFQKLGLIDEGEVNRRVMAVLAFLDAGQAAEPRIVRLAPPPAFG